MTDQFSYSYPSPLEGYENLEPLSECVLWISNQGATRPRLLTAPRREKNEDGKSLKNAQNGVLSKAYEEFPDPLTKGRRGGFDVHIYHFQVRSCQTVHQYSLSDDVNGYSQNNPDQVAYARALWERIRRECKQDSEAAYSLAYPFMIINS